MTAPRLIAWLAFALTLFLILWAISGAAQAADGAAISLHDPSTLTLCGVAVVVWGGRWLVGRFSRRRFKDSRMR